ALLGPNGSGKTTLLQILTGLRKAHSRHVRLLGTDVSALTLAQRQSIGYIAEGQSLPDRMRLAELEAYLMPLYPRWDRALAARLRARFELDPRQRLGAMSRGQRMKAALLCALAPRPRLLLMDEPFTGMDAQVKDDLVRGLLDTSGDEGWTVLLCSHDIGELEMLADWVAFLQHGSMRTALPMDELRSRFRRVDVLLSGDAVGSDPTPGEWMSVERSGPRLSFVLDHRDSVPAEVALRAAFPGSARIDVRDATLREVFVALAKHRPSERARLEEVTS
ncbi:MAG: ABC transporter ATP-binding protein, partial [bacterium]